MGNAKAWLGWALGALAVGALVGWLRLRRRRSRPGAAGWTAGGPPPRRSALPPRRPSQRTLLLGAAAALVVVAIVGGSAYLRPPSAGRPVKTAGVGRVPTALSSTRVPRRLAAPTAPVVPTAPPGAAIAASPTPIVIVVLATPAGPVDPLAAVRALGPLRGMGYNPTYATADVPPDVRAQRLHRDLRLMAQVGVNMVLGWDPGVFDEELLAAAQENGIGVVMPFDLKPDWDYADPELRAQVSRDVADWVRRFRDQPAVLMWGIGNEVTIEMGDDERRAFADFYVQLFDQVHALDPTRPVVLREAEDVFAPYLAEAFARQQGFSIEPTPTWTPDPDADPDAAAAPDEAAAAPRPVVRAPDGFVYGVNFYTERVGDALANWVEDTQLDAPLLVSEYAPAGVGRAVRAQGFAHLHELIAASRPRVLGSAPYTWTTAGPEAVDDYFGLVDADGHPVDQALAEIARLYGVDPPEWAVAAGPRPPGVDQAELPGLIDAAVARVASAADLDRSEVRAAAARYAADAGDELGVDPDDPDEGAQRARQVVDLVGWARELSAIKENDRRLFPGMHEALPLLNGMARWSRAEPSALDTARGFMAAVLRRDLTALGG